MYNNESTDDHLEALAPYLDDGTVILHEWPMRPGQMAAYDHCLQTHGPDSRWIAFIDLDEFLFSPTLQPLPGVLASYEDHPGVVVNWVMFGTSGHLTRAPGLVIETHDQRKRYGPDTWESVKSIVNPSRVERVLSPHAFLYRDGLAVDEQYRVNEPPLGLVRPVSFERLRLHHYAHRSEEEYLAKLARPQAHSGTYKDVPEHTVDRRMRRLNEVRDDTIKAYIPEVRAALARAGDAPRELQPG
jgi:hypothetical protein